MKSNLILYTSYVTKENIEKAKELNLLPIFVLRKIRNSEVIGKYSGTAIHFYSLAPSDELYHAWRDGQVSLEEYRKQYIIEMSSVKFHETVERLEYLASLSNASGIVLMGYGQDPETSHRSMLAGIFNASGLLNNTVTEIDL